MARSTGRLSALAVSRLKDEGRYGDGGGLYLQIGPTGTKAWLFRFMLNGRAREMGLGPLALVSLAAAREKAQEARRLLHDGIDPIDHRDAQRKRADEERQQVQAEQARGMSFRQCADAYIAAHRAGWKNAKHASQWETTLSTYAYPVFGDLPVSAVDLPLVLKVLEPMWREKTETASRLRGRIEAILGWATVRGYREGDNPARWRGHLDKLLPQRSKVQKVEHHAALPYAEMSGFMAELRKREGMAARALEFAILTAARTNEVLGAHWSEIDLNAALWTIPGARMKSGREHRVPLSEHALKILGEIRTSTLRGAHQLPEMVFPGAREGRPLSNMALLVLLRRMGRDDLTAHGFRSSFRDWAAERTGFPAELAEMALAHAVSDKVEAAYRRGDMFMKRRKLMEAWAAYCNTAPSAGQVVDLSPRKAVTVG